MNGPSPGHAAQDRGGLAYPAYCQQLASKLRACHGDCATDPAGPTDLTARVLSSRVSASLTNLCLPQHTPNHVYPNFKPPKMSPSEDGDRAQQPLLTGVTDQLDADGQGYGTAPAPDPPSERGTFARNLGTLEAFGIVISIVIGSGVFTSPGAIDTNVPSPGVALVVWLLGGVLAWTGASTLAELGTAIPGEGLCSYYYLIC